VWKYFSIRYQDFLQFEQYDNGLRVWCRGKIDCVGEKGDLSQKGGKKYVAKGGGSWYK
jgi:hypothetical protein